MEVPRRVRRQPEARGWAEVENRVGADAVAGVRFVEDDVNGRAAGPVDQLQLDPRVDTSLGDCLVFASQAVSGVTQYGDSSHSYK